jgi:L-alanine-DL-glutamate epimerase-like enolase superfamily enzyme
MDGTVGWFEDALVAEDISGYKTLAESIGTPGLGVDFDEDALRRVAVAG